MNTFERLRQQSIDFPHSPGVYMMMNDAGEVLYVGKAKDLKKRISCYFRKEEESRPHIAFLLQRSSQLQYHRTQNEKEALLLELNLIRKHHPKYNMMLKDDKSYLSLKLNSSHDFPSLTPTRKIVKDKSEYFGPYPSALQAREVHRFLEDSYRLRNCSDVEFANRSRPCLQYQIGRCDAPCVGFISKKEYDEKIKQIKMFLKGDAKKLLSQLRTQMNEAAEKEKFEQAARLRDLSSAIEKTLEKQQVQQHLAGQWDVIGFAQDEGYIAWALLRYREDRLIDSKIYFCENIAQADELLNSFVLQAYQNCAECPQKVILPFPLEDEQSVQSLLEEKHHRTIKFILAKRHEAQAQIKLASLQAEDALNQKNASDHDAEDTALFLKNQLHLNRVPHRIECYDISQFQGDQAVGSCVCFVEGKPFKKAYRKFKIKWIQGQNDFAMLQEVLQRRLNRSEWVYPDLIIIDGGKGQLSSAAEILKALDLNQKIDLVSLAKERVKNAAEQKIKPERVFMLNESEAFILPPRSAVHHLFVRIRDEAHRFAITYQRSLQQKSSLKINVKKR